MTPAAAPREPGGEEQATTLKPLRTILAQEIRQAEEELKRPLLGILLSGLLAGLGIGASTLAVALILSLTDQGISPALLRLLVANASSVGFILVILAHADLFTEYTTLAILPVLTGRATGSALARLWLLVYAGNLTGAGLSALLIATLGPELELFRPDVLDAWAIGLVDRPGRAILLSAVLTGWLMGLLSWLIAAARETISQIVFIWIITGLIGLAHLHHSILGTLDVVVARLMGAAIGGNAMISMIVLTTMGNAIGGVIFALLIRYGLVVGESGADGEDAKSGLVGGNRRV